MHVQNLVKQAYEMIDDDSQQKKLIMGSRRCSAHQEGQESCEMPKFVLYYTNTGPAMRLGEIFRSTPPHLRLCPAGNHF